MKYYGRTILYIGVAVCLVCLCTTLIEAQSDNIDIKLGYIDLGEVFETYHKSLPEYNKLEKEFEEKKNEILQLQKQLKDIEDEVKNEEFLSAERRKELSGRHVLLKVDYDAAKKKAQASMTAREGDFTEKVFMAINDAVREVGTRDGYSMIFRKSDLLYGSQSVNLTRDTLKQLEKNRKTASISD